MSLGIRKSARWGLMLFAVLLPLALLAPGAEGAVQPRRGLMVRLGAQESSNWAGYDQGMLEAGKTNGFHQVSAKWVVPKATQHSPGRAEYSSTWVGIGGGCIDVDCTVGDGTLIQAGTNQDVDASGHATYGAWYEIIPAPQLDITSVPVKAGDVMSVDIREIVEFANVWTITVKNVTNGKSFTTTLPYTSTHATAEWIVETPIVIGTDGTGFAAMPNLQRTTFTNVIVNKARAALLPAEKIYLISNGQRIATPSGATSNRFSVCTYATSC